MFLVLHCDKIYEDVGEFFTAHLPHQTRSARGGTTGE